MFLVSGYAYHRKILNSNANAVASLVTVVGVFGTFVGIFSGLLGFNPVAIEASVPPLLGGMRLAFVTSIFGLLISGFIKRRALFYKAEKVESAQEVGETPAEDIINQLISLNQAQQSNQDAMESSLSSIQKALTGDGETTLLTQLIRLRTGFSDKLDDLQDTLRGSLDKLAISFDNFAQTMTENDSSALIEALEEVMRDFNSKINEQFGDNFKQLNEAVGQILVWQEQYQSQMTQLAEEFSIAAAASIDSSKQSLSETARYKDD
jgi:RNAse (barnase) inhibitor barstar